MTIETRIYSEMLYSLAGDIDSDEGCFMESAETLREAAQRLDEQTATIRSLIKQRDKLLAAAELLLSRKRPGEKENDPRLILEIDCINLEDAIASVKGGAA